MHRVTSVAIVLVSLFFTGAAFAQDDPAALTTTCNFDQDKQLVLQYQHVPIIPKRPLSLQIPFGKVWAPGGKPMTLFTNTAVEIGGTRLPIGAYTMFVIPNARQWTLIISKSTQTSGAYDDQQDMVRLQMEAGELPSPEPEFRVSFAHIAANQCSIRVDMDKFGHFAIFQEK
ncbi:MAG: DUF2911 domain-containing protein [Candidatus Korobacteraceae bacterium]|jgi:hypothetical protein